MAQTSPEQGEWMTTKGVIFDIKRYAIHDGPGIRVTVFLKGCPLECWWCHNPEGRDPLPIARPSGDAAFYGDKEIGRTVTLDELMAEIEKETIFLDESGGGVTFSGGEPLMQPEFLKAALRACHERELHTTLDTTGYAPKDTLREIAGDVELFLYDLKLMDDEEHRQYTGVSNRTILENLKLLAQDGAQIAVSFAVIPGITDTSKNIRAMAAFLSSLESIKDIRLLPFHAIAEGKYERLGMENKLRGMKSPPPEQLAELKADLEQWNFNVQIGG
jgi:pyruvate formate lyase activating enzyme